MERQQKGIDSRYERKFVIPEHMQNNLHGIINTNKFLLKKIYKERIVNSIYYDFSDMKLARENIDGLSNRKKVRIRYYGNIIDFKDPNLEIKIKTGSTGKKKIFSLENIFFKNIFTEMITHISNQEISPYIISLLKHIEPKVFVSYKRLYFLSNCKKYRLTYDSDIRYLKIISPDSFKIKRNSMIKDSNNILEIKYPIDYDQNSYKISKLFPFRVSRNSKYIVAIKSTGII